MDLLASSNTANLLFILSTSLIFSAFFSGMEIAFISANRLKVELDKKQGGLASIIISRFVNQPKRFIAAMLVGNNIAMVIYSLASAELLIRIALWAADNSGSDLVLWLDPGHHFWVSMVIRTVITTIIVLFAAEFIPKALFRLNPNIWLNIFAIPLQILYFILWLPSIFVTSLSNSFIRLLVKTDGATEKISFGKIDLDHYLQLTAQNINSEEGLTHEIQILQNALDFSSVKARECMVPRNEIIAHNVEDNLEELTKTFIHTGLSKILIWRDSIDNIIGYVHSFELFKKPNNIKNILLPIAIVPEPMPANEVLETLINQKRNMALVLDEFGGTAGIVTMEDIVEEIFGEIEDEHDSESLVENQVSKHAFVLSARHEIDYLNDKYKFQLPDSEEYDTLGGLILHLQEEIPAKDEIIFLEKFQFTITEVSDTRIEEVKLTIDHE